MAFYQHLNRDANEVRMLSIVDPPDGSDSGLVHCVLEHVSLDDVTAEFAGFLATTKRPFDDTTTKAWIERAGRATDNTDLLLSSKAQLLLPAFRWKVENGTKAEISEEWEQLMSAMGTDVSRCPKIPQKRKTDQPTHIGQVAEDRSQPGSKVNTFCYTPRFKWGDFEAISYCWERDVRDHQIVVNGNVFAVPKNLEALLQRLRTLPDSEAGMRYWIDALCIDQKNLYERNHQVTLMNSIYIKAFAVIIWLGEAAEESDKAIDFIASGSRFIFNLQSGEKKQLYFDQWEREIKNVEGGKEMFSALPWKPLFLFFMRNYWRRLWQVMFLD